MHGYRWRVIGPLCEHTTSSTKPDVYTYHRLPVKDWAMATGNMDKIWWSPAVWFLGLCQWTDRQTDLQTDRYTHHNSYKTLTTYYLILNHTCYSYHTLTSYGTKAFRFRSTLRTTASHKRNFLAVNCGADGVTMVTICIQTNVRSATDWMRWSVSGSRMSQVVAGVDTVRVVRPTSLAGLLLRLSYSTCQRRHCFSHGKCACQFYAVLEVTTNGNIQQHRTHFQPRYFQCMII